MIEKQIVVRLNQGLHARPAALFVKTTASFSGTVKVGSKGKFVDGKSILGLMSLAIGKGQEITVVLDGTNEQEVMLALEKILLEDEG